MKGVLTRGGVTSGADLAAVDTALQSKTFFWLDLDTAEGDGLSLIHI